MKQAQGLHFQDPVLKFVFVSQINSRYLHRTEIYPVLTVCDPDNHKMCPLPSLCLQDKTYSDLSFPVLSSFYSRLWVQVELGQEDLTEFQYSFLVLCKGKEILFPRDRFFFSVLLSPSSLHRLHPKVLPQPSGSPESPIATVTPQDLLYPHSAQVPKLFHVLIYFKNVVLFHVCCQENNLIKLRYYDNGKMLLFLTSHLTLACLAGPFGFFPPPFPHFSFLVFKNL